MTEVFPDRECCRSEDPGACVPIDELLQAIRDLERRVLQCPTLRIDFDPPHSRLLIEHAEFRAAGRDLMRTLRAMLETRGSSADSGEILVQALKLRLDLAESLRRRRA